MKEALNAIAFMEYYLLYISHALKGGQGGAEIKVGTQEVTPGYTRINVVGGSRGTGGALVFIIGEHIVMIRH